jgi:hypothetical protein
MQCRIKGESVGLPVNPPIVARQRLATYVPAAKGINGGVVFYAVRVVSKESNRLVLPRTSCNILTLM